MTLMFPAQNFEVLQLVMGEARCAIQTERLSRSEVQKVPYSVPIPKVDIISHLTAIYRAKYEQLGFFNRLFDKRNEELTTLEECISIIQKLPEDHPHAPVITYEQAADDISRGNNVRYLPVGGLEKLQFSAVNKLIAEVDHPILLAQRDGLDSRSYRMQVASLAHIFPGATIAAEVSVQNGQ